MEKKPKVSFEIEGYVFFKGKPYVFSENELSQFEKSSEDWSRFHPVGGNVLGFMIEGKTFPVTNDIEEAAKSALANLNLGLNTLKGITRKKLEIICDSNLYDALDMPEDEKENAGTHVHVDYQAIDNYFNKHAKVKFSPELVIWRMRQSIPEFVRKYCSSRRLKRKLEDPRISDFGYLGLLPNRVYRQTINYRGDTIEVVIADSTDNLQTLTSLGKDVQECVVEAAEYIVINPGFSFPDSPAERIRQMNVLVAGAYGIG